VSLSLDAVPLEDRRRVATWTQLRRAGYPPAQIKAQIAGGRWRRHGHAIVLHNGPLSREQRWYVARVHGGPHALLTGFTAAEAYGLRGWERTDTDLLVPRGARVLPSSPLPLNVHRVRDWSVVRQARTASIHVPGPAFLVAASTFAQPRPACGILAAGVQQRILTVTTLEAALERAPRIRHRSLLVAAVADIGQGSQALSEIDFVRLCRRHGLPPPDQQTIRREPYGRRRYLDATWRRRDGRLVVVEVDGALHLAAKRWWDDQLRQNEIALTDALILRFPSIVVRTEERVVVGQLRRALLL
jgi:hypothetical protein